MAVKHYYTSISIANLDGNSKDAVKFGFAFQDVSGVVTPDNCSEAVQDLFNASTFTVPNLGTLLSQCLATTADIRTYDITGHEDGSPHGSPVDELGAAAISGGGHKAEDNSSALCIAYHGDTTTVVENGPSGPIPTPEQAKDYGAPDTHPGITKPRARRRGRFYLGPLEGAIFVWDANNNPTIDPAVAANVAHLMGTDWPSDLTGRGIQHCVWSRRDAALYPVVGGWVDQGVKNVRRREYRPGTRTTY